MNGILKGSAITGMTAVGLAVSRLFSARSRSNWPSNGLGNGHERLWHIVTVNRPPEQVAPDGWLPPPLLQLGDTVEVQMRPAPARRGTELAVRLRSGVPSGFNAIVARLSGNDPRQILRSALREAKQLVETGEVLSPDRPTTNEPTLLNRPLDLIIRRARGEGRL